MKKFRFYHEERPEVNEVGHRFMLTHDDPHQEIYLLTYYYGAFHESRKDYTQYNDKIVFKTLKDAELTIKNLLRTHEPYKGYKMSYYDYHDWGIVYIAVKDNWETDQTYLWFTITFQTLQESPRRYF